MVYTWKYLVANSEGNVWNSAAALTRTRGVQDIYNTHLATVDAKYGSRDDFIKIESLKWKPFQDASGKLIAVKTSGGLSVFLEPNKFEYDLRKGIRHYVLWSETALEATEVEKILGDYFGTKGSFLWFVNAREHRSIPGIWHAQVFAK